MKLLCPARVTGPEAWGDSSDPLLLDAAFCFPTCWSLTLRLRCVGNKLFTPRLFTRLPGKPAGLLMGGPETWERIETVLQHSTERS